MATAIWCKERNLLKLISSNGGHYGLKIFKTEKNLEFFRLQNFEAIDGSPGKLE